MAWIISRFRAGDLVEVRGKEEILATLDRHGCIDGMPFMPEMLRYCGKSYHVVAVAHKTCDTSHGSWQNRRVRAAVHLAGLRCDGSAHGGCQAECTLFWKDAWLRPVATRVGHARRAARQAPRPSAGPCGESQLLAQTQLPGQSNEEGPCYSCQATRLFQATEPMAWWDPRQYVLDVLTGNRSIGGVLRVLSLAALRYLTPRIRRPYRFSRWFHDWMHQTLTGRGSPFIQPRIPSGQRTPAGYLDLKPGEFVRIKSKAEIEETLDTYRNNRGLGFDPEEMAPYCEGQFRVRGRVERIVDEKTGKMRVMKQPCIVLENVTCRSEYANGRLNCPRAIFAYWREIWLERVNQGAAPNGMPAKSTYGSINQELQS